MSIFGKTVSVVGELRADEDVTLEGHIEGLVLCEGFSVVLTASADVVGDVIGREITVLGSVAGKLIATDVVDIRPGANVTGQVLAKRFVLAAGAYFTGRVEPQHLEAALRISKIEQRKRDTPG